MEVIYVSVPKVGVKYGVPFYLPIVVAAGRQINEIPPLSGPCARSRSPERYCGKSIRDFKS